MKNKTDKRRKRKAPDRQYTVKIPSREQLIDVLSARGQPVKRRTIVEQFGLDDAQKEALSKRLNAMTRDGQLIRNRRGAFGLAKNMDLVPGRIHLLPGFLEQVALRL